MTYTNFSIHWPDPDLLKRIKAAAKARGVSPAAFIRDAAERALKNLDKTKT